MKKILFSLIITLFALQLFAGGILIKNAVEGSFIGLHDLAVNVEITNQVAITTFTASFINTGNSATATTFAFPMHEEASSTGLSWYINGSWHDAIISPGAQDPVNPPDTVIHPLIDSYLGKSPLVFGITEQLSVLDTLAIQVHYVELLKYQDGMVNYSFPLNYRYLSNPGLETLQVSIHVGGGRNVTSLNLPNFPMAEVSLLNGEASADFSLSNFAPNQNIDLSYGLAMENLGAITFSSFVESEFVPDELGDGFFLSVVEPAPSVDVIQKYFTFVMDRSALMHGASLVQAKLAASYMISNLNQGDYFNIVDFNTVANTFALNHVPYNTANRDLALSYIDNFEASGMCNISGAFDTSIPQFAGAPANVANIIVFLSKGVANVGIQDTNALIAHVDNLVNATGRMLNIFCFGVGTDVNAILLSQISAAHGGTATWVGISDLSSILIDFYNKIRNPVLLNPSLTIDQTGGLVLEVYPASIPNLYLGTQMLLCGRYPAGTTSITFEIEGNALGSMQNYHFKSDLSPEPVAQNVFLMKIWAKMKIDHLMAFYNTLDPNSPQAIALKQEIIDLSIAYGVLCKFTSFANDDPGTGSEDDAIPESSSPTLVFQLSGNYPNPFNPSTNIRFELKQKTSELFILKIFNAKGQLVRIIRLWAQEPGLYTIPWDGLDSNSALVSSGVYYYTLQNGAHKQSGKMLLLK
jgi:Ca-activated chloride channel family protein